MKHQEKRQDEDNTNNRRSLSRQIIDNLDKTPIETVQTTQRRRKLPESSGERKKRWKNNL